MFAIPVCSLMRRSKTQSTNIPAVAVNATSPTRIINTTVPMRAPRVDAEKSPYPMVVMEMMLYQKLSPMVKSGCDGLSKKKKVRALPRILVPMTAAIVKIPRLLLRRIRRTILWRE